MIAVFLSVMALLREVELHQLIGDHHAARNVAQAAVEADPESSEAAAAYIKALAAEGHFEPAARAYDVFLQSFDDAEGSVGEAVAWAIIEAGLVSNSAQVRGVALIGAGLTRTARSVQIVTGMLRSPHALERLVAVQLSVGLRDSAIREEMVGLLRKEKEYSVRLAAIAAVGAMKMQEARPLLESWLATGQLSAAEIVAVIEAIVSLLDTLTPEEVAALAHHPRGELRLLACRAVGGLDIVEAFEQLIPALEDPLPAVREGALEALGLMGVRAHTARVADKVRSLLQDPAPEVAIRAAWLLLQIDPPLGKEACQKWLGHHRADLARLGAGAVAACGSYGLALARTHLSTHPDPYVRANLALGLIEQRVATGEAARELLSVLRKVREPWMWKTQGMGQRVLVPSRVHHDAAVPNRPELTDQLTRLDVLGYLTAVGAEGVTEEVKKFLLGMRWGVSGMAALSLLQEGDESALLAVRQLLSDPERKIRVQAALALAILGRDPDVVDTLIGAYEGANRDLKLQILEALMHIGDRSALPFLRTRLLDPSLSLRVVAASAMIRCFNA